MQNIKNPSALSGAALAYVGDAVWELEVRRRLVLLGTPQPAEAALTWVTATAQSDAVERLLPHLTEEETDAYRRGRNSVCGNVPRRATVAQYRRATGLEALFGFLYLSGRGERLEALAEIAMEQPQTENEINS